jgi:hypothetical protein
MKKIILSIFITLPLVASAQPLGGIKKLLVEVDSLVRLSIPIAYGLAILFFFWGMANFILRAGDPTAKEKGRGIMVWGVIALFIISTIFGIVALLRDILGIPPTGNTTGTSAGTQSPIGSGTSGTGSGGVDTIDVDFEY